jgi:ABC-type transport system involved in cytochrome c biogenesis ATPase subunit
MRIERVLIRGLRALRERDDHLVGLDGEIHSALCLRGLNGSGKTTYLLALAELWQWFRRCASHGRTTITPENNSLLLDASLVAALFTDLPGPQPRIWIAFGHHDEMESLIESERGAHHFWGGDPVVTQHLLRFWSMAFERAESGLGASTSKESITPPNFVLLEAENKYVPPLLPDELTNPRPTVAFAPVARYQPESRGASHLDGLLRTLYLARRERWDIMAKWIERLRPGLQLLERFDEATQRPLFRLTTGAFLTVEHLSAGERSLLINLAMVLRWLSPGGIVLLDEPELHQHLSLMRGSLAVLHSLIAQEFAGQLIVASHAPEVWDHFSATGSIIELEANVP